MPMPSRARNLSVTLFSCLASFTLISSALVSSARAAAKPTAPPRAPGADQVKSITLANGLKVIVWTDRDIPNVALYNWVRVGSRNEVPGITGLAHFFEHMMFNGTAKRAPGEFDRMLEAQGGSNNAYTSDDVTVYQNWIPRSALDLTFDLEADRLANLSFDPKVIESERGVVYSERRLSVEDDNAGFLFEQVQSTAFVAHTYQIPTIGWPSDIQGWTVDDLQKFFKTNYAPNNCTFVLVGDVSAEEVFALARKYLEPIPRQEPPPPVRTQEPEQLGEKRVHIERPAQTPLLYYAYKSPAANQPLGPAINLLMSILVEGNASRLNRLLVEEKKLAIEVGGAFREGFDPNLTWLNLTLPENAQVPEVERALDAALSEVVAKGVTEAELARAKNHYAAGFWKQLATINGKAAMLGQYEVFEGDYTKLFDSPAAYERVTAAQVQQAAAQIFVKNRRTVGVLQGPQSPQEQASPEPPAPTPAAASAEVKP